MNTLLVLGLALVAGLFFTRIMKLIGLPDVTGYLLAGLLIGPYVLNLMTETNLETLNIITTSALGFIAFSIGSSFKKDTLRQMGGKIIVNTLFESLSAVIVVDLVLWLLGVTGLVDIPLPLAIVLGAIAAATAPAATLMVVRQYKAKGIVTDTLLPIVGFDDAVGLMAFAISIPIAKVLISGGQPTFVEMFLEPLAQISISLAVGAILGLILALCSKLFKSRVNRITLIIAVVFAGLAISQILNKTSYNILHLSSLLVCMMIGAIYSNVFKENEAPLNMLEQWTYPLFMLFFVISGAELRVDVILSVGVIGVVYIVARSIGKYFGASLGAKVVKADKNVVKYLGFALLPQAGVAIGMATLVVTMIPEYGVQINTVILCATFIYELFGPMLTKMALTKAGEIEPGASRPSIFSRRKAKTAVTTEPTNVTTDIPNEDNK
ncbi:MAG: cation:proton antiporter [Clostridia bacterium]|nr:cation:proton antiporter [Clostridia bacterium]